MHIEKAAPQQGWVGPTRQAASRAPASGGMRAETAAKHKFQSPWALMCGVERLPFGSPEDSIKADPSLARPLPCNWLKPAPARIDPI